MIKTLHTENFRMLSGERDFEFPEGIIGIVGPNGSGKSTLVNSIAWTMYGQEALTLKARDPISWGAKETLVRVGFDLNDGTEWTVERSQKPTGLGKAKLYVPGQETTPKADGSAPTTNAMTELMGVDREGFMVSVFARQGELDRLRSLEAAPRMQMVLRLLGINQITKAVKIVREDGNDQKKALDALRASVIDAEAVEGELRSLDAELVETNKQVGLAKDNVEGARNMIVTLQEQRAALEPKRKAYMTYSNELQSRKTTLAYCEQAAKQAKIDADKPAPEKPKEPEYKVTPEIDANAVEELKSLALRARDTYAQASALMDQLQRQALELKDTCPTCGRPFDDAAHIERERQRLAEREIQLVAEIVNCGASVQKTDADWKSGAKALDEYKYLIGLNQRLFEGYKAQVTAYEVAAAHRAQAGTRYAQAVDALDAAQTALASLVVVDDLIGDEIKVEAALDSVQMNLNLFTETLAAQQADVRTLETEIARLHAVLSSASESTKQAKKIEKEVVSHETTATELQRLKETMIGKIIPSLNERASALVEMMTDGKYSELSLTPDYEIEYRNPLGDYKNFLNLSGGEQVVFALALRLAISDLRAGNLGVIFLDEAISGLSSEDGRQESVWQAIESLTGRFRQIMVITHVEAYKDRAPFTVRL